MKKCLIILTRKYPYAAGEPFLESEIDKHIQYYDKILILSQDVSRNENATRVLPKSVEYTVTASGERKEMRMRDMMHSPRLFFAPDTVMKNELESRTLTLPQRVFLSYFKSRCNRLAFESTGKLDQYDFSQYGEITIYSYWFFANAMVAVDIKNYLTNSRNYSGRILLVSRAHRYDIYEEANRIGYLPCRKHLLNEIDYVFPCSENGTEYLKTKYQDTKSVIETAYLGTRDYGLSPEKNDDCFHIVSCSRVVKVKGLERLIDDLSLLVPEGQKILWNHIGGGVEGKTSYFESVKRYAESKLRNISFEFLGSKRNTEVYEYYKNTHVDVFINVSYSEGLPVSLMEASGFGIPVIATDVGGSSEIIDEDRNGFLLPKDFKKGELAEKIRILLEETPEQQKQRRTAARTLWDEKYNAEKNYALFAQKLASL